MLAKIFFSEDVCLRTKLDLRLKKNFLREVFKITTETFLCRIWKLYGKHFFKKKLSSQFFLSPLYSSVLEKQQKWFIFFSIFFENVWKFYGKHFLHTLDVWNCMIRIFDVWKCIELRQLNFYHIHFKMTNLKILKWSVRQTVMGQKFPKTSKKRHCFFLPYEKTLLSRVCSKTLLIIIEKRIAESSS